MRKVVIRTAVASEQKALEALQWRASLNNQHDRDALLTNPDAIALPLEQIQAGGVFVAEDAATVVGFAVLLPRGDGDAELDGLFVEPACARQGVGRVLVTHCCLVAKRLGANVMYVVGNPHARSFYAACRFEEVGLQQTQFGVAMLMKRPLQ